MEAAVVPRRETGPWVDLTSKIVQPSHAIAHAMSHPLRKMPWGQRLSGQTLICP